jgi:hypothetical protein
MIGMVKVMPAGAEYEFLHWGKEDSFWDIFNRALLLRNGHLIRSEWNAVAESGRIQVRYTAGREDVKFFDLECGDLLVLAEGQ